MSRSDFEKINSQKHELMVSLLELLDATKDAPEARKPSTPLWFARTHAARCLEGMGVQVL